MSMRIVVDNGPGRGRRQASARGFQPAGTGITLRAAQPADAPALLALIAGHLDEGHLLPRSLGELVVHAPRFVVAVQSAPDGERIVGCAELAPLSSSVAEVRSLVVGRDARKLGLGRRMVDELGRRARVDGFERLCAFAHDPRFFVRHGFSVVPHTWVPEKIAHDCSSCPLFRQCGQYAIVLDLQHTRTSVGTGAGTSVRTAVGTPVSMVNHRE